MEANRTQVFSLARQARNPYIDLIRGLAVFLVTWGHCIQFLSAGSFDHFDNRVFQFIYSFHMPLFALISGYLFWNSAQRKTVKELTVSRAGGLLYPAILWGTIYFFLQTALDILQHKAIRNPILSWWNTVSGSFLWFLWVILISSLAVMVVEKYLKSKVLKTAALAVLFVFFGYLPNGMYSMFLFPFFTAGYYYRKYEERIDKRFGWVAVPVFIMMFIFYNRNCFIYTTGISLLHSSMGIGRQLCIDAYRYLIGFAGSITVFMLVKTVADRLSYSLKKVVGMMGRFSLEIYILQCFAVCWIMPTVWKKIVEDIGTNPLIKIMPVYEFVITPVVATVAIAILILIIRVIGKNEKLSQIAFGR